jgi:hypothetical protein
MCSLSPHQHEDQQDHEDNPDATERPIAPACAVAPSRIGAAEEKDEENN